MRDTTRDYTIAQFRLYASLGFPSKAQVVADKTMHRALQLDLLAVIDTLDALTSSDKDYIRQAVCAVYFVAPTAPLQKGEINFRVTKFAINNYTDERTVFRWLKEARLLCADYRGLNIGTDKDVSRESS
ncbi:hypothetical protein DWW75_06715 [Ruminococcus sp. AF17-11]|jgi:hypothetical protein|nr:hypothetical protein [Ruminococcus sp. AF17-11]RGG86161.1 hypothetical protein DWW75_06715 [Ruminococcus sp. AF17-11]